VAIIFPRSLFFVAFVPGIIALIYQSFNNSYKNNTYNFISLLKIIASIFALFSLNAAFSILPQETIDRGIKFTLIISCAFLSWLGYKNLNFKWQDQASLIKITWSFFILAVFAIAIDLSFGLPLLKMLSYGGEKLGPHMYNRSLVVITFFMLPCFYLLKECSSLGREKSYFMAFLLIAISLYAVAISDSQSTQLAIFASFSLMFICFLCKKKTEKYFWLVLKLSIVFCILFAPVICRLLFSYMVENPELLDNYILQKGAAAARVEIWDALSQLISQKPIFGYGANTTRELVLPSENVFRSFKTILHPHNFALQIWLELGLIGVIGFSYIFWRIMGFIEKIPQFVLRLNALGVFIAWLSVAAVGYGMWQSWWVGLTLTLILFYVLMSKRSNKKA